MKQDILNLVTRHCDTLREESRCIDAAMASLVDPNEHEQLSTALAAAHKLKGSSGSLGFAEVSAAAQTLEFLLRELEGRDLSGAQHAQLLDTHRALQRQVASIAPESSALYQRFVQQA